MKADVLSQTASKQGVTFILTPDGQVNLKSVSTLSHDKEKLRVTKEEMRAEASRSM